MNRLVIAALALVACGTGRSGDDTPATGNETPAAQEPMTDTTLIRAKGTVRSVAVEGGCWRFDAEGGAHYELGRGMAPADLLQDGKEATLTMKRRPDMMSTCMVGPIVEVVKVEQ